MVGKPDLISVIFSTTLQQQKGIVFPLYSRSLQLSLLCRFYINISCDNASVSINSWNVLNTDFVSFIYLEKFIYISLYLERFSLLLSFITTIFVHTSFSISAGLTFWDRELLTENSVHCLTFSGSRDPYPLDGSSNFSTVVTRPSFQMMPNVSFRGKIILSWKPLLNWTLKSLLHFKFIIHSFVECIICNRHRPMLLWTLRNNHCSCWTQVSDKPNLMHL